MGMPERDENLDATHGDPCGCGGMMCRLVQPKFGGGRIRSGDAPDIEHIENLGLMCDRCGREVSATVDEDRVEIVSYALLHADGNAYSREHYCELARAALRAIGSNHSPAPSGGLTLIAAERQRQITVEGWTPEHDDAHDTGELADAAACYAAARTAGMKPSSRWPWSLDWWKPSPDNRVRDLVKAGALIVAEIERLQRAASTEVKS